MASGLEPAIISTVEDVPLVVYVLISAYRPRNITVVILNRLAL